MKKPAQGMVTVEFALIAAALFIVLFAVIELSRIIWIWNTADEATRRGARVAAVCPIDHPAVKTATVFADPTSALPVNSPILRGLDTNAVSVEYLDEDGEPEPNFSFIKYVRVSLNKDPNYLYTVTPLIPFINITITVPAFSTTIPSESLGLIPDPDNPAADPVCSCFSIPSPCQP